MAVVRPPFPHVVIRAAAGTGKTFQLTKRYLSLINAGVSPAHILAVTFTRKAAGEILDRLLLGLAEAALSTTTLAALQQHMTGPALDRASCVTLLQTLLRGLHQLQISTLDSFFVQIARGLALELGLPIDWQIVEELEDQQLRIDAMQALWADEALAELVTLLRLLSKGDAPRSVVAILEDLTTELLHIAQQTEAQAWHALPRPSPLSPAALEAALQAIATLRFAEARFTKARDSDVAAARCQGWATLVSQGLAGRMIAGENTYYRKPIISEVYDAYQPLLHHARAMLIGEIADQTEATWRILERFRQAYRRLQVRRRAFRFEDITQALARTLPHTALAHIDYRLDAPLAHLLVDEFQDTALTQWDAIRPWAERMTAQDGHSFFCVGDSKQAIYGWRGGMAELLDAVGTSLPHVTTAQLDCSYRSSQVVIDTVNTVFDTLHTNPVLSAYPAVVTAWRQRFTQHTTTRTDLHGYCCVLTAPVAHEDAPQAVVTLQWAAEAIARLHREHPDRTMGILVRRNHAVAQLIALLRHVHGIAASEEGGNPLTDSVAVQLILSLLRLADHPGDTVACFHVAHSPLGLLIGLERYDDQAVIYRVALDIRQRLMTMGYGQTISSWVQALADACDQRELHRLLQLVELAYGYEAQATERPTDFVAYVAAKKVEDTAAAPVRVMTIHQAKGLQFAIVVLPELDIPLEGHIPPVVVGRTAPTHPITAVCRYVKKELRPLLPAQFQQMFEEHTTQVVNEALCLLYVAMTRAMQALYLMLAPARPQEKTIPKTLAGMVRGALCAGLTAPPETMLYEHGAPDWHQRRGQQPMQSPQATQADAEAHATFSLQLRPSSTRRGRGLERVRPSQAAAPLVPGEDWLRPRPAQTLARGSLLHAWLEQIEWLDDGEPDVALLRRIAVRHSTGGLDIDAELQAFYRLLAVPQIRMVLSRRGYEQPAALGFSAACCAELQSPQVTLQVLRERPFAIRDGDAIVHGIIDRLVLYAQEERVIAADILDFKSEVVSVDDASAIDAAVTRYQPQLMLYQRAIGRQYALDLERIAMRLCFLQCGVIQPMAVGHTL
jgi:ATP-dependent exoDNAse (exonuclease V) beta subunit